MRSVVTVFFSSTLIGEGSFGCVPSQCSASYCQTLLFVWRDTRHLNGTRLTVNETMFIKWNAIPLFADNTRILHTAEMGFLWFRRAWKVFCKEVAFSTNTALRIAYYPFTRFWFRCELFRWTDIYRIEPFVFIIFVRYTTNFLFDFQWPWDLMPENKSDEIN